MLRELLWSKWFGKKKKKKEIKRITARKESSRTAHFLPEVRQQPIVFIYDQRMGENKNQKTLECVYYTRKRLIS